MTAPTLAMKVKMKAITTIVTMTLKTVLEAMIYLKLDVEVLVSNA
jgi:hypothetical protein